MTKQEYIKFVEEMDAKALAITKAKNADYTGNNQDPFANFSMVEALGICSTEVGFLVRMTDKFMRINSFVQKGILEVKDESVTDTLLDLSNYSKLFAGYLTAKREQQTAAAATTANSDSRVTRGDGANSTSGTAYTDSPKLRAIATMVDGVLPNPPF